MKILAQHFRTGAPYTFHIDGGTARKVRGKRAPSGYIFGPGWVDLQCNGYAGVDFNHPDITPEAVCAAVRAMWKAGCTTVLPTVITNHPGEIERLLRVLVGAREMDAEVRRSVPGFHLEGPFISPEDGARGAHPLTHVRPPSLPLWRRWQTAAQGLIRMITIAPELPRAISFIRELASQGVVVTIGHTMADASEVSRAAEAGATLSTHLGNGCPVILHRHDNPIAAQLGEDRLRATFIPDGIHLPSHVLRSYVRAKQSSRSIIVTDAMAAAGAPPGCYTLGMQQLQVGRDRVVRQPGKPNFAGSALTMAEGVFNYASFTGSSLTEAWIAGSTRPAAMIGSTADSTIIVRSTRTGLRVVAAIRGSRVLLRTNA